ncbi:MAG: gliding motility-associated C-terminal domain-containing protein, partial [Bacteroidetes bacterium]|nr:gliding motility-associated C-terminal domain-containing protein [Bacteroidota bacterium]
DSFKDDNNDGWDDRGLGHEIPDTDNDGFHNFRDINSDGTGPNDGEEFGNDCDNDGIDDYIDPDMCESILDIPTGFSPNGDGINDFFEIRGIELVPNNNLKVFNRWGTLVYNKDSYQNDWAGTSESQYNIEGNELPTGTYYYVLETNEPGYGSFVGYVYIQRK